MMKPAIEVLIFMALAVFSFACGGSGEASRKPGDSSMSNKQKIGHDIGELKKSVNLPFEPEKCVFEVLLAPGADSRVPGPSDWRLSAFMEFSADNAARLQEKLAAKGVPEEDGVVWEDWFPDALKASLTKNVATGQEVLMGPSYAANDFYKSPLLNGRIIRIGKTNYFFLTLHTN